MLETFLTSLHGPFAMFSFCYSILCSLFVIVFLYCRYSLSYSVLSLDFSCPFEANNLCFPSCLLQALLGLLHLYFHRFLSDNRSWPTFVRSALVLDFRNPCQTSHEIYCKSQLCKGTGECTSAIVKILKCTVEKYRLQEVMRQNTKMI